MTTCAPRCHLLGSLLPLALLCAPSPWAGAADWPQWRGAARDGRSGDDKLLEAWPSGGPTLLWKATGLGVGYSSLAVAGGRIITMGDLKDHSQVFALDLQGQKVWSTPLGKTGGNYAGTRSTPTVDGDLVFALGQFGDLACLAFKSGELRWKRSLQEDLDGSAGGWNYAESPLVDGERLVCSPGGKKGAVAAFQKKTGELLWRSKDYVDSAEYSSLMAAEIAGRRQYVHLSQRSLVGIAPEDGRLLWKVDRRGETAVIPTPIIEGDRVYVTSGYGVGCNLFEVRRSGDGLEATQVYANKVMANHHGGVVKVGEHLYGYSDGKGWVCQELATGKSVWNDKSLGKGSIAYADGHLYLRSEGGDGDVALIDATPKGWHERGRFQQPFRSPENSWAHPVVAGGRLYLRDMDILLAYDVRRR